MTSPLQDLVEQIALNTATIEAVQQAQDRLSASNAALTLRTERLLGVVEGQSAVDVQKAADRDQRNATLIRWGDTLVAAFTHWSNGRGAELTQSKTVVWARTSAIAGLGALGGGLGVTIIGAISKRYGWV